jgi:ABC-2 type transport system ATP-binding protein
MDAIVARGLTKTFHIGRRTLIDRARRTPDRRQIVRAVDGIDLEIGVGETFGVLGPNGAGKTTTLRMLSTLLEPTGGEARVMGISVREQPRQVRRQIGAVLSGERSVYWKLTARENLQYFAALYHIPRRECRERIAAVLEEVQLTDRADDYVERFSTGMRQRLVLARALLPDAPVLLIDEPTVGLDPQAALHMRDRIRALHEAGKTILLTTHYMDEADQLCDRIAIVDHGHIVALGTPAELKRSIRGDQVVRLEIAVPDEARFVAEISRDARVAHRGAVNGTVAFTLHCSSARDLVPAAFDAARTAGGHLKHVEVVPVTLEEVFLSITGRGLRE